MTEQRSHMQRHRILAMIMDFGSGKLPQIVSSHKFSRAMVILLAVVVTMLTIVSPQKLPTDLEEGQISGRDIKADRNYEIVDNEATGRLRQEAADAVLKVFDFDDEASRSIATRIHDAFESAERQYRIFLANKKKGGEISGEEGQELKSLFAERLGVEPTPQQWKVLVDGKFSKRIESVLADAVRRAMSRPVVMDKLAIGEEKEKGIVIRRIASGTDKAESYDESTVKDLGQVLTLDDARAQTGRFPFARFGIKQMGEQSAIEGLAKLLIQPNCNLNRMETERRRAEAASSVANVFLKVKSGEMIIREGARYEPRHIKLLNGIRKEKGRGSYWFELSGTFFLVLCFLIIPFCLVERFFRRIKLTPADHYLMGFVGLSVLLVIRLSILLAPGVVGALYIDVAPSALYFAIPVAGGAMLIRMFLGAEVTLVFAVILSVFAGMFTETEVGFTAFSLACSFTGVIAISKVDRRSQIIKAGILVGAVGALVVLCLMLMRFGRVSEIVTPHEVAWSVLFAFIGGVGSSVFVMIAAPLVESISGYTSDIKLLELANLNHPLLRELIVRAPGTYHHSHMVGILGEAAAEAIGANALLVRVGAYYHDIGKMKKPLYFIENTKGGENRHERLSPHMSALIVSAHIKDGLDMAAATSIPKTISDMIPQHHGTRMISYFYEKAKERENAELQRIDAKEFMYPGPKPQTREAAILMLADASEAAVRSLREKSSTRIQQTVQRSINDIFAESQLDECELTLKDLNDIARAFVRIFLGIYHHRIEYPKDSEHERGEVTVVDEKSTGGDSSDNPPENRSGPSIT